MPSPQVERDVRFLKVYSLVSTLVLLALVGSKTLEGQSPRQRFTEIDVERINVVEGSGQVAMVISNSARQTRVIWEGREQPTTIVQPRPAAGLIFVDAAGNEVGGLIYNANITPGGGFEAVRSLTFDQHNQDQVIAIQYVDGSAGRRYGLSVWDRPSAITSKEMADALQGARDEQTMSARLGPLAKARGVTVRPGLQRIFLGSQNGTPSLRMADVQGRDRVRMVIGQDDQPRLEFLDAAGSVVYALPPR